MQETSESDDLIDLIDHHHLNKMIDRSVIDQWLGAYDFDVIANAVRKAADYKPNNLAAYVGKVLSSMPRRTTATPVLVSEVEVAQPAEAVEVAPVEESEDEPIDQSLWDKAKAEMQLQLASSTYYTWLHESWAIEQDEQCLTVAVANTHAQEWVQHRLRGLVRRTLRNIVGGAMDVTFVVRPRRKGT